MAVLLLLSNAALAQRTVKGKVTDAESSEGLIGATVTVVGTTRGAVTDIDGNYSVEVPDGSTQLRFAYTGYEEQVIDLGSSDMVEIAMKPGSVLDEVVVVGYGTVKAKEVTSAVASLKKEDFNKGNISSASQLIQGKIAGVSVSRPGSDPNGEFTIRLRGLSSLSNTGPLIVVDGIPGVSIGLIDPNDIETFDVLKDGSAAAIYGTRASAGVVLITTKKGSAGRTIVDYNAFVAIDQVASRYKVLSSADFIATGGTDFTPADGPSGTDTDWFNEITQTGVSQVHNLSLSGGVGNGGYRASFNYRDVDGILRNTGFKRYNGGLNFYQKAMNNRLNI
ncbi:MAG: TonB-dependent receptor plug domain-containing protein, partial [Saprospiraceae bacterium]